MRNSLISNNKPEAAGIPKEILKLRWTHMEEMRVQKILLCREERKQVFDDEQNDRIEYVPSEGCFRSTDYVSLKNQVIHSRAFSAKERGIPYEQASSLSQADKDSIERLVHKQETELRQKRNELLIQEKHKLKAEEFHQKSAEKSEKRERMLSSKQRVKDRKQKQSEEWRRKGTQDSDLKSK